MTRLHILGAHKAGTTKLYELISSHPDVYGSSPKQNLYFVNNPEKVNLEDYYAAIGYRGGANFTVDATPDHMFNRNCINKICEMNNDYRLIVTLRNPIDRAYSHWCMTSQHRGKKEFLDLVCSRDKSVYSIILRSSYHTQLKDIYEAADKFKVSVFIFEDWIKHPDIIFDHMQQILNLDLKQFWGGASENSSYRSHILYNARHFYHRLPGKKLIPRYLRTSVRGLITQVGRKETLSTEERGLIADVFRESVHQTYKIVGQKNPLWDDFK